MKKIVFLCPYFGTLPPHTQLWLNSCKMNPSVTWYLFTDDKRKFDYPENVQVFYTTLEETKALYQKKFDFEISLEGAYKLGDYKPLFGYLYEEMIQEFDAWGHIDVYDEIYGDIRVFVTDELLEKYDKLMIFGHMGIYKNSPEVNRRFELSSDLNRTYQEIFSSSQFYNFEEYVAGSITRIYQKNGFPIGKLDEVIADLSGTSYHFRRGYISDDFETFTYLPYEPMIFSWEEGKTYCYSVKNHQVQKDEFMYVHFKRRKMIQDIPDDASTYLIVPSGFALMPEEITVDLIRKYSQKKLFYPVYFEEKWKGFKRLWNKIWRSE
ncbi:TPA: DUF6625 family protein [Streptococcus pneumoniae]